MDPMQKRLAYFQEKTNKVFRDDLFVHLTIYDVPASLLKEFTERIVKPCYPEGISSAIKDLMLKAIQKQNQT